MGGVLQQILSGGECQRMPHVTATVTREDTQPPSSRTERTQPSSPGPLRVCCFLRSTSSAEQALPFRSVPARPSCLLACLDRRHAGRSCLPATRTTAEGAPSHTSTQLAPTRLRCQQLRPGTGNRLLALWPQTPASLSRQTLALAPTEACWFSTALQRQSRSTLRARTQANRLPLSLSQRRFTDYQPERVLSGDWSAAETVVNGRMAWPEGPGPSQRSSGHLANAGRHANPMTLYGTAANLFSHSQG